VYIKNICLCIYLVPSSLQHYYGICKGSSVGTRGTHCRIVAYAVNSYRAGKAFFCLRTETQPCLILGILL